MDCPRDLGQLDLWRESLERSLARRGRPERSSVELHRLRGDRDLLLDDVVLESSQYSQLRRRAAQNRPLLPRPTAGLGGVSALTLLAVTTLPGLLGDRSYTNPRVAYAAKVRGRGRAAKRKAIASARPRSVAQTPFAGPSTLVAFKHPAAPTVVSMSEDVRELQQRLGVAVDGDFGPITLSAVRAFQATHGLVVDGIVGPATRAALRLPAGPILRAKRRYFPRPVVHKSVPPTASGYVNPLAQASVTPERIDMGVDYAGTGSLTAIGEGRVTYVGTSGTGWPGAFLEYQLMNGPDAGRYVYYAEGLRPAVSVGQVVGAGQAVAYLIPGWSSGIELGWGSGIGTSTLAEQLGEHIFPTAAGESFSALIASLGAPPGIP